jgi:hypothetical protein
MPKPIHVLLGVLALLAAGSVAWLIRVVTRPELVGAAMHRPARPVAAAPAFGYAAESIGIAESDHPAITALVVTDLDGDGLSDVVACDATENQVSWIRQAPRGTWTETALPVQAPGPVRVLAGDFTGDGQTDLLVGCQGSPAAADDRTGRVVLIEHPGDPAKRTSRTVIEQVWPVTDLALVAATPGRVGLAIATAGQQQGRLYFLERTAAGDIRSEVLATGGRMLAVAAPAPAGPEWIAALEAGERDIVRVYRRSAAGAWEAETRGTAPDPGWGGTMLAWADVNHDGGPELVVANGDRAERYPDPHAGQGVQWLAANGAGKEFHAIGSFPGVHAFAVADLSGDGWPDLVSVATGIRPLAGDAVAVVAWINRGPGGFERVPMPGPVERVAAVAVGDLDGNGVPVIVTGADHARSAAERSGRVTLWRRR